MNKQQVMIGLLALPITLGMVVLAGRRYPAITPSPQVSAATRTRPLPSRISTGQQPRADIPLHLPYEVLFRRIKFFTDKNIPDDRLSALLQAELGIKAGQAEKLKQVALRCMDDVGQQDARAQAVIARNKARYPGGIIRRGQEPPSPSPELAAMQQERNMMFLQARSSLQDSFNQEDFRRFEGKVKGKLYDMAAHKRPVSETDPLK